jgi:hypothetical protein
MVRDTCHSITALHLHARMVPPGKHVVFGKVIRGFDDVVSKIAQVATDEKDRPVVPVIIFNCGELELRKKAASPLRSWIFLFHLESAKDSHLWLILLLCPPAKESSVSA